MEHVSIEISFEWSAWTRWEVLAAFKKHRTRGPIPTLAGVYEIRRTDADPDARLFIGSANRLTTIYSLLLDEPGRKSVAELKQTLLEQVDDQANLLELRWATTEEYAALERYLRRQYIARFGRLPLL